MFDRTDVRVAEFVAYRDQLERLLPIILSALFGRPYVGKELDTKVHLLGNPSVRAFFQGNQPKASQYNHLRELTPHRGVYTLVGARAKNPTPKQRELTGTEGSNPLRSPFSPSCFALFDKSLEIRACTGDLRLGMDPENVPYKIALLKYSLPHSLRA